MSSQGIIIAAKAAKDSGKTTAVLNVWRWLKGQSAKKISEEINEYHNPEKQDDVTAVLEYQGILIGISSKGDPGIDQAGILDAFIKAGCRVIVCACRTWGQTREPIDALQQTWIIRYIGPVKDGFVFSDDILDAVKKAVQEIKSAKN